MLRLLALAVAMFTAACSPGDAVDAVGLLRDLGGPPSQADVERRAIAWTDTDGPGEGDLYKASSVSPRAGIVLVPGLAPEGRDDPRLVALAFALARRSFAVLVPELPGFRAQRVSTADRVPIAAAVRRLRQDDGPQSVGLAAISYAVGPAILASLTQDPAGRVDFLVAVGGYYDATAVTTFFTTGYFRDSEGAPWQQAQPNAFGKWVFVAANAERLEDAHDRTSLTAIARRKLASLDADIADLATGLRWEGRAVMALLANTDPARVPALIDNLPPGIRADLDGLNLKRQDLARASAQFILIHGRDDAIIPYTESVGLARALPAERVHLALLDNLAHADLGPGSVLDGLRLWWAGYALMRQRR